MENIEVLKQIKGGKISLMNKIIGTVIRRSAGRADGATVKVLLQEIIEDKGCTSIKT